MRKFVELELEIVSELDKAIVVSDGEIQHYLPKSMIAYTLDPNEEITNIQMPEWLAHKKGLI